MKLRSILKNRLKDKRGLGIGDLYPIILTITLVAILLAISLYVLASFGAQMTNGSAAQNATTTVVSQFTSFIPWIGVILLIVAAAIVLGIVISSFTGRTKRV